MKHQAFSSLKDKSKKKKKLSSAIILLGPLRVNMPAKTEKSIGTFGLPTEYVSIHDLHKNAYTCGQFIYVQLLYLHIHIHYYHKWQL